MFPTTQNPVRSFLQSQVWFGTLPPEQQDHIAVQVIVLQVTGGQTILQANVPTQG